MVLLHPTILQNHERLPDGAANRNDGHLSSTKTAYTRMDYGRKTSDFGEKGRRTCRSCTNMARTYHYTHCTHRVIV